ncbi:flagellar biosynthesis protein FliQ [Clostridium uliginosum]|uniref:Flagellar biosynthetic protein FliQ n=1 Tax=Clostridium uliginosum TaxID=119641 RepID=A0A1I1KL55_9CLOT|nr:flagellar biosynthesis protein FliQ [Clostridium uliginosum]SFC61509.1 flagellar biosynthetic protein FliQ [Clostridium uliginosum]
MSQALLNGIIKDTIIVAVKLSAPILIVILIVGLIISILQATTQVQEQTLTFIPKLIASAIVGILLSSWMLQTLMSFTTRIFDLITKVTS